VLPRSSQGSGILLRWVVRLRLGTPLRWESHLASGIHLRWVPALAVILVVGLAGCSGGDTPSSPPPSGLPQAATAKPAAPAPAAKPEALPFVYEAKGRRDPFLPLIAPKLAEGKPQARGGLASLQVNELKLAGIIWGQRSSYALVEAANGAGYVLRINDVVGADARVTSITPQAVTFEVKTAATLFQPARTRVLELRLRKEE